MTIPEILNELETYNGRFPKAAMEAAIAQQEAITPELLRVIEAVAADPMAFAERMDYMLHLFAFYLLAQFREQRAFVPIIRICAAPAGAVDAIIGETITGGLSQILASVYDGNAVLLEALIESDLVNDFVRGAAVETYVVLAQSGRISRDEVIAYYRSLFAGKLKRENSYAWNALACSVAGIPAPELAEDARRAFAEDLVDPEFMELDDFERDLAEAQNGGGEKFHLITNAVAEMEWWAAFDPDESGPQVASELLSAPPLFDKLPERSYMAPPHVASEPPHPIRREQPKIGRNDPCPCNSGKKYKKCCGR